MRNTRFIFVEGIMGSGKSTTAEFLTEHIQQHGIAARFLLEGPTIEEPEHPLRIATEFPHPNAIWLDLTVEEFIERSLHKWHTFVQAAQQSTAVTICDGLLFHGNMTDTLLMNAEPSVLYQYVAQVIECLHSLNPVVIYFYHTDIARAIRTICDERGSAWEAYQVNWKSLAHMVCNEHCMDLMGLCNFIRTIVQPATISSPGLLPKLAICNEGDWTRYYREIWSFGPSLNLN